MAPTHKQVAAQLCSADLHAGPDNSEAATSGANVLGRRIREGARPRSAIIHPCSRSSLAHGNQEKKAHWLLSQPAQKELLWRVWHLWRMQVRGRLQCSVGEANVSANRASPQQPDE